MSQAPRRVTLSIAFLAVMLPLVGCIAGIVIWQSYSKSVETAIDAGRQLFSNLATDVALQQNAMLGPVRVAITALAETSVQESAYAAGQIQTFLPILEAYPHLAAIRVGYDNGMLFELAPARDTDIEGAAYAVTTIDPTLDDGQERVQIIDRAGVEKGRLAPRPTTSNPATESWYSLATATPGTTVETLPYRLRGNGVPGISAVRAFAGSVPGVIAVDIALSQFSLPLESLATETDQQMFMFTGDGRLFANKDFAAVFDDRASDDAAVTLRPVESLSHPAAAAVVDTYRAENGPFSTRRLVADGAPYMASVTRLVIAGGQTDGLFFAFALPESTVTGAFISIARDAVLISLGIIALSIPLIVVLARRLARPLASLAEATDRITQLDLTTPVAQPTRIREIASLGESLDRMKSALGQMSKYVPKSLVQDLIESGHSADVGGERRELSYLFTDVRDFTPMAESTPAEELMAQMSQYFDGLVAEILARQGTVDKHVGDAIFAYWNAARRQEDHVELACLAALGCRATSNRLNAAWEAEGRRPWYTRFAVHFGEAVVGNVGSIDRIDYTAVGNSVNVASRIKGLNKFYGTQLLVSGDVVARVKDKFLVRYLDTVSPKGAAAPLKIYELIGTAEAGPVAANRR